MNHLLLQVRQYRIVSFLQRSPTTILSRTEIDWSEINDELSSMEKDGSKATQQFVQSLRESACFADF